MMLCSTCELIFARARRPDTRRGSCDRSSFDAFGVVHQPTYASLVTAAENSCCICRALLIRISKDHPMLATPAAPLPKPLTECNIWRAKDGMLSFNAKLSLAVSRTIPDNQRSYSSIMFHMEPLYGNAGLDLENAPFCSSTNIAECGDRVREWITACTTSHSECCRSRDIPTNPHWYPTRLLEISCVKDSTRTLRVFQTCEKDLCEPYVTLSHCWGGANIIKLTSATLQPFSSSIVVSQLPRTFRDAIEVADFLGIHYLWIDCLCIIQDSEEDWLREAALMGDVYRNSFCNIGATASKDSHGGLFRTRNPSELQRCLIRYEGQPFELVHKDLWEYGLDDTPLGHRGWAVQERWLAPRMLHFSQDQIFWECRTLVACESHSSGPPRVWGSEWIYDNFKWAFTKRKARTSWPSIVRRYSSSKLTFETDKLIALSGLAKVFCAMVQDEYIAGMWKTGLVQQLAWAALGGPCPSRMNPYVAPTWSWVSLNGPIGYRYHGDEQGRLKGWREAASILQVQVYAKSDLFGQITGGFIRIQGPLSPISMELPSSTSISGIFIDGRRIWGSSLLIDVRAEVADSDGEFYCLSLFSYHDERFQAEGLLLKRVPHSENEFRRVGVVVISDEEDKIEWFSTPRKTELLSEEFFDPEKGYTIVIT